MKSIGIARGVLAASILGALVPAMAASNSASPSTPAGTATGADKPLCSTLSDKTVPKMAGVDCTADAAIGVDDRSSATIGSPVTVPSVTPNAASTNQGSLKAQQGTSASTNGAATLNAPKSASPTIPDTSPNSAGSMGSTPPK
jgi:hypothetical protein